MIKKIYFKALLVWLLFIPFPIVNGLFRENYLRMYFSPLTASIISTLLLSICFFLYAILWMRKQFFKSQISELLLVGFLWILLTTIFEWTFGLAIEKKSVAKLLEDYQIFHGRIWSLFLALMLVTPWLISKIPHQD